MVSAFLISLLMLAAHPAASAVPVADTLHTTGAQVPPDTLAAPAAPNAPDAPATDDTRDFNEAATAIGEDYEEKGGGVFGKVKSMRVVEYAGRPETGKALNTMEIRFDLKGSPVLERIEDASGILERETTIEYGTGWQVTTAAKRTRRFALPEPSDSLSATGGTPRTPLDVALGSSTTPDGILGTPVVTAQRHETYEYRYDGRGRLRTMKHLDGKGTLIESMAYSYADRGGLARVTLSDGEGSMLVAADYRQAGGRAYESDVYAMTEADGQQDSILIRKVQFGKDGKIARTSFFGPGGSLIGSRVYDSYGNPSNTTVYGDSLSTVRRYDYKFDDNGSWTQRSEISGGKIASVTIRTIDYYTDLSGDMDVKERIEGEAVVDKEEALQATRTFTGPPAEIQKKLERKLN